MKLSSGDNQFAFCNRSLRLRASAVPINSRANQESVIATKLKIRSTGVSLVVLRGAGSQSETLLLRRATKVLHGAWCQVAGGIEPGEAAWQTALRELKEETGLTAEALHSAGTCEQYYEPRTDDIYLAPVFVAFVSAQAVVSLNHEHSEYQWVSLDAVDEYLPTPNQREMFAYVRRQFAERSPTQWSQIDFRSRQGK